MKKNITKYDYIFLFILIIGLIFFVQQLLFSKTLPEMKDTVEVTVVTTPPADVLNNLDIGSIQSLYFNQHSEPIRIVSAYKKDQSIILVFKGAGIVSSERYNFSGEFVGVGKLVKLSGGFIGDGYITKIEKVND